MSLAFVITHTRICGTLYFSEYLLSIVLVYSCYVSMHPNYVAVRLLIHRVSLKLLYAFEQHTIGPDTCLNAYDRDIPYRLPYVRTSCCSRLDNNEC